MNKDITKANEKINKILKYLDDQKLDYIDLKILEAIIHEKTGKATRNMVKLDE